MRAVRHFIGGTWADAASGRTYDNRSPWSGEVIGPVAAGDDEDARRAIDAAHTAFSRWSQAAPALRQTIFLRAADILAGRRASILEALAQETGCGSQFGAMQVDFTVSLLRQAAQLAYRPVGELLASDISGTQA